MDNIYSECSQTITSTHLLNRPKLDTHVSRFLRKRRLDINVEQKNNHLDKTIIPIVSPNNIIQNDHLNAALQDTDDNSFSILHERSCSNDTRSTASSDTLVSKPLEGKVILVFSYTCEKDLLLQLLSPLAFAGASIGLIYNPSSSKIIKSVYKTLQSFHPLTRLFKIANEPTIADITSCLMHAEHEFESEDIDIVINIIGSNIPSNIKRRSSNSNNVFGSTSLSPPFSHALESAMISTNAVLPSLPCFPDSPAAIRLNRFGIRKDNDFEDGGRVINVYGDSSHFAYDTRPAMVSFANNVHRMLWRQRGVKVFAIHPECTTCSILSLTTGTADHLAGRYLDKQFSTSISHTRQESKLSVANLPLSINIEGSKLRRKMSLFSLFGHDEIIHQGNKGNTTTISKRKSLFWKSSNDEVIVVSQSKTSHLISKEKSKHLSILLNSPKSQYNTYPENRNWFSQVTGRSRTFISTVFG